MEEIRSEEKEGKKMERQMGFEPTTLSLARRCSTTEPLPLGVNKSIITGLEAVVYRVSRAIAF